MDNAGSCFAVASGDVVCEGYGRGGAGVCLGDGQAEIEVPSQGGMVYDPQT